MSVSQTELQRKQIQEVEELLFDGPEKSGFVKELYFGHFSQSAMMPFLDKALKTFLPFFFIRIES